MKDDDEDDEVLGAVRYPCMPSLVALQQMRNRLHLAYLGRKLMKWSALATGREMRRMAAEINEVYASFQEDLRNAFILLARSRYFFPDLNKVVTENYEQVAYVSVTTTTRTISGVKVHHYDIVENENDPPYQHLGIGKGGIVINEAKKAWLDLLKRMVLMAELRNAFTSVENAHKQATKKRNVLSKMVIPRIIVSIRYILSELEEMEREEMFRLKRVKQGKVKKGKADSDAKKETCVCAPEPKPITTEPKLQKPELKTKLLDPEQRILEREPKPQFNKKSEEPVNTVTVPEIKKLKSDVSENITVPETDLSITKPYGKKAPVAVSKTESAKSVTLVVPITETPTPVSVRETLPSISPVSVVPQTKPVIIAEPERPKSTKSFPPIERATSSLQMSTSIVSRGEERFNSLKKQLTDLVLLAKQYIDQGLANIDIKKFGAVCEDVKLKIEQFFQTESFPTEITPKLEKRLEHLKGHLREVIDVTEEFRHDLLLSPSVEKFVKTCQEVEKKIDLYVKKGDGQSFHDTKSRLDNFKSHIQNVAKLTEDYKKEGLLTPSVEAFLKSCEKVTVKLDTYLSPEAQKINQLKKQLAELKSMANEVKNEGIASVSMEEFMTSCKDFENKLENYKSREPAQDALVKLVNELEDTIELGKEATQEGLISSSVEEFIKCCEDVKKQIQLRQKEGSEKEKVKSELASNIDNVLVFIKKLKEDGLVSSSVENFIKSCEETKAKICGQESELNTCNESCCTTKESTNKVKENTKLGRKESKSFEFEKCKVCDTTLPRKIEKIAFQDTPVSEEINNNSVLLPCKSCTTIKDKSSIKEIEKGQEILCKSCSDAPPQKESESPSDSILTPAESLCEICKKFKELALEQEKLKHEDSTETLKTEESDENLCDICKKFKTEVEDHENVPSSKSVDTLKVEEDNSIQRTIEKPNNETTPTPSMKSILTKPDKPQPPEIIDSSLGYFEKKTKEITRVKRFLNPDGTIREEKEIISIRKHRRDPHGASVDENDDDDECLDLSYESLLNEDKENKRVAMFANSDVNRRGFLSTLRETKSELLPEPSILSEPILRRSISEHFSKNSIDSQIITFSDISFGSSNFESVENILKSDSVSNDIYQSSKLCNNEK